MGIDVTPIATIRAERVTADAALYLAAGVSKDLRPVYCPGCGTHFTTWVPAGSARAPTCVHYLCGACGGDGQPVTLAAPR